MDNRPGTSRRWRYLQFKSITPFQLTMQLTDSDIDKLDRIQRLNIINSVTGIKPANLIGTVSDSGKPNLAIFSSVVHLGSNPPLIGFMLRPQQEVRRHTFENIMENGYYTINHVHSPFVQQAHYTSAKFEKNVSEFEACHLTEEYLQGFKAPFVKESLLKLGMEFVQNIPIPINGTSLIVGKIKLATFPDEVMDADGHLDLTKMDNVGISGLNSYYGLNKIAQFPYARPNELPGFSQNGE